MEEKKEIEELKSELDYSKSRCPDYDSDCKGINHLKCYIGGFGMCKNGAQGFTDQAKGFCPHLNHSN